MVLIHLNFPQALLVQLYPNLFVVQSKLFNQIRFQELNILVFKLEGRKSGMEISSVIVFGNVVFASFAGTARAVALARPRSLMSTGFSAAVYDRHGGPPALPG